MTNNERTIQSYLNAIEVKLVVILTCCKKQEYELSDVSLSLLRKACTVCGLSLKENDNPNGWSYDYVYSIVNSDNQIVWLVSGSLWYGELKLIKHEEHL